MTNPERTTQPHTFEQFRDPLLEVSGAVAGFYPREFFVFDNFASFQVEWQGQLWPTSEHAYQAAHFFETAPWLADTIHLARSAHDALKLAKAYPHLVPTDWDEQKEEIMLKICRDKLRQHPYIQHKLLQTGEIEIVEDSPKDSFWGWGPDRQGRNTLGKIWMTLRDELRNKEADL